MKHWRRTSTSGPTSAAPTCHQVTLVSGDGNLATFLFDAEISSIDDISAFEIDGVGPTALDSSDATSITLSYAAVTGALPWSAGASGVSFLDGNPLCPGQTGVVE